MSISDRLDRIEQRAEDATEGPWVVNGPDDDWAAISSGPDSVVHAYAEHVMCDECGDDFHGRPEVAIGVEDAEFIADARTTVPALVSALRAVLDMHKPMTMYEHEDCCENDSDDHREERHAEDVVQGGEYFCMDLPTGIVLCHECSRDLDFDGRDYPCPTVRAITAALGEES